MKDGLGMSTEEKRLWLFARAGTAVEGTAKALAVLAERLGIAPPHLSSSGAVKAEPWELILVHGGEAAEALAPHLAETACAVAGQLGAVVVAVWVDPANDVARAFRCLPQSAEQGGPQSFSGRRRSVVEEASLYLGLEGALLWPLFAVGEEVYPGELPLANEEERFVDEKLRAARTWMRRYLESKENTEQGKGR